MEQESGLRTGSPESDEPPIQWSGAYRATEGRRDAEGWNAARGLRPQHGQAPAGTGQLEAAGSTDPRCLAATHQAQGIFAIPVLPSPVLRPPRRIYDITTHPALPGSLIPNPDPTPTPIATTTPPSRKRDHFQSAAWMPLPIACEFPLVPRRLPQTVKLPALELL